MSCSFRGSVLGVVLACALAPQLVCFMPDETLTQSEMDCCKEMASDCSSPKMSHACCQTVVQTDVGIAAKVVRNVIPRFDVAERMVDISATVLRHSSSRELPIHNNHAPPKDPLVSSSILRI